MLHLGKSGIQIVSLSKQMKEFILSISEWDTDSNVLYFISLFYPVLVQIMLCCYMNLNADSWGRCRFECVGCRVFIQQQSEFRLFLSGFIPSSCWWRTCGLWFLLQSRGRFLWLWSFNVQSRNHMRDEVLSSESSHEAILQKLNIMLIPACAKATADVQMVNKT